MPLNLEEAKTQLRTIIRTIDRKAEFTANLHEGEPAGVSITVALRRHKTTILIPARDLEAAAQGSMQRSQLRTTIKRAIDRMTFEAPEIASTKMVRGQIVEGGFFRAQQGGRGYRR